MTVLGLSGGTVVLMVESLIMFIFCYCYYNLDATNMLLTQGLFFMFLTKQSFSITPTSGLLGYVLGFQKMCLCRCGIGRRYLENIRTSRLAGGELISPHEFPWLVAINTSHQVVPGSLISDQHIITAASPLYGTESKHFTIALGAHDRCDRGESVFLYTSVDRVILHPAYTPTNNDNDIALIKLKYKVTFSQYIAPVCMPHFDYGDQKYVAWTLAWSKDNANSCTPRVASLPMMSSISCLNDLNDTKLFTPDKACLGPLGSKSIICKSDVGAPVMSRWSIRSPFRLIGVISSSSCEGNSVPLYTRVVDHAFWIYQYIRKDCQCF